MPLPEQRYRLSMRSHAKIASALPRRNAARYGDETTPAALRIAHMVVAATGTPSNASSPWIRR